MGTTKRAVIGITILAFGAAGVVALLRHADQSGQATLGSDRDDAATSEPASRASRKRRADGAHDVAMPGVVAPPVTSETASRRFSAERMRWPVRVTTDVAGAEVTVEFRFFSGEPASEIAKKTADAEGFAGFAQPESGRAVAAVTASARADGRVPASKTEQLDAGEFRLTLRQATGPPLRGVVVDAQGRPIEGVDVIVVSSRETVHTNGDGRFEVYSAQGETAYLAAHASGSDWWTDGVATGRGDVRIVINRGPTISGRITFPDLRPVSGARVAGSGMEAVSDGDGRFSIAGDLRVVHVSCALAAQERDVQSGATDVDFVVTTPVARIRLTDETCGAFRYSNVFVRTTRDGRDVGKPYFVSAPNGEALVAGRPGERLSMVPLAKGFAEEVTVVEIGADLAVQDVTIVVRRAPPTGRIRLAVRSETGAVPKNAYVTLNSEVGRPYAGWAQRRTAPDPAGRVEFADVVPGRYDVVVDAWPEGDASGYEMTARGAVEVAAGSTSELPLVFASGGRIRVTLHDDSGEFVAPEFLEVFSEKNDRVPARFLRVIEDGVWTPGLGAGPAIVGRPMSPGRYVVAATLGSGTVVRREVAVERGVTADVDVRVNAAR